MTNRSGTWIDWLAACIAGFIALMLVVPAGVAWLLAAPERRKLGSKRVKWSTAHE